MMHLHFLHGFLGLPRDWGPLLFELKALFGSNPPQFHMHNLWNDLQTLPDPNLRNWGLRFAQKLPPAGNILIGYSLGGRLAMHFPVWEQRKISGIVLISAHPGLVGDGDKALRLASDQKWAARFRAGEWDPLVQEWNAQAVFAGDRIRPPRREADFSRPGLAGALEYWSLGRQDDMMDRLREFQCPIHYIHGAKDEKYSAVGQSLALKIATIKVTTILGAGHSPHFSDPAAVALPIKSLIVS